MQLIDFSYFIGTDLHIVSADRDEVKEKILFLIKKREPEILKDLLGYSLYSSLAAAYDASQAEVDPVPLPEEYAAIINGATYTDGRGHTREWQGLRQPGTKTSLIAKFVYYWYMRQIDTQSTVMGETIGKLENSERVSNAVKMCAAWNEMAGEISDLGWFLHTHKADYPTWGGTKFCNYKAINPLNV